MFRIELGAQVHDEVTGFKGTVTGRHQWITGCDTYTVTAKAEAGKEAVAQGFDDQRLAVDKPPSGKLKALKPPKPVGTMAAG